MPNWCHNTLMVRGDKEVVAAYVEHVRVEPTMVDNPEREWMKRSIEFSGPEQQKLRFDLARKLSKVPLQIEDKGQPLTFTACAPEPDYKGEEVDGPYGFPEPDWYLWRINNWGTKWDASFGTGSLVAFGNEGMDVDLTHATQGLTLTDEVAIYKFDTAWSPPQEWALKTATHHPELRFVLRFAEVGHGYAGQLTYEEGYLIDDQELQVDDVLAPEEMWF